MQKKYHKLSVKKPTTAIGLILTEQRKIFIHLAAIVALFLATPALASAQQPSAAPDSQSQNIDAAQPVPTSEAKPSTEPTPIKPQGSSPSQGPTNNSGSNTAPAPAPTSSNNDNVAPTTDVKAPDALPSNTGANNPVPSSDTPGYTPTLKMQELLNSQSTPAQNQASTRNSAASNNKKSSQGNSATAGSNPNQAAAQDVNVNIGGAAQKAAKKTVYSFWVPLVNVWVPGATSYAYLTGNLSPKTTNTLYGFAVALFLAGLLLINKGVRSRAGNPARLETKGKEVLTS